MSNSCFCQFLTIIQSCWQRVKVKISVGLMNADHVHPLSNLCTSFSFRVNKLEPGLPLQSLQIMIERDRTTEREERAVITLPHLSFSPTVLWGTNCARPGPEQPQNEHSCVKDESLAWEPHCNTSVAKRAEPEKLGEVTTAARRLFW